MRAASIHAPHIARMFCAARLDCRAIDIAFAGEEAMTIESFESPDGTTYWVARRDVR